MTPEPAHYYHAWTDGAWFAAVAEHFRALNGLRFQGRVSVTLVGEQRPERDHAFAAIRKVRPTAEITERDSGFEEVTLNRIRQDAASLHPDTPVLYCHTKGSFHAAVMQNFWRQAMTGALLTDWPGLTGMMRRGSYDAAGLHWLTPENWPDYITTPMFGGNFWWARAGYLAALPELPPLDAETRHQAEAWIGLGDPKVLALSVDWPNYYPEDEQ